MKSVITHSVRRNELCACGSQQKFKYCCGKIPSVNPGSELLKQARIAVNNGNLQQAERYFQALLALDPNHPEALAGLGQCLCWRQNTVEGLQYLKQAAQRLAQTLKPGDSVKTLIDLSLQLLHWGDLPQALSLAETAVQQSPEHAAALNNLALCYSRSHRDQEALVYATQACKLLPDEPGCNILLAILESRTGRLALAQQRLEHILQVSQDPAQTARATLELGKVFDQLGQYEQAFRAFCSAGRQHLTLPAIQAIPAESVFATLKSYQSGFTPELFRRWPIALLSDDHLPTPIFLLGFLRSGTTLAEQVLAAHPEIITSNEEPFIATVLKELRQITHSNEDIPSLLQQLTLQQVKQLRQCYWQQVINKYGNNVLNNVFIDKMALNTIEIGLISLLFPDAKIIFALRDPRDVCLSCFMQAFNPSPVTVNLFTWTGIAQQYAAIMDYWLAMQPNIAPEVFTLRYEDTVSAFETTFRQLFKFLGLAWHPDCTQFYTQVSGRYIATPSFSAVNQPIYTSAINRWQHYSQHFAPVLPELRRFIEEFGYD